MKIEPVSDRAELSRYLEKINRVFEVDCLLREVIEAQTVVDYYTQSSSGYELFHSADGAVHMALNFDGRFDPRGYEKQAQIVSEFIDLSSEDRILEMGCGQAFNSILLSKLRPRSKIVGLDLTAVQLRKAVVKNRDKSSPALLQGDFANLPFSAKSFDLLFDVESLCHTFDMRSSLLEVGRILRSGGKFILFDGFRGEGFSKLTSEMRLAARLIEASMAVRRFWSIGEWLDLCSQAGFTLVEAKDISHAVKPNLNRLQVLARGFFKSPGLAKNIRHFGSEKLVLNAVAGLLMPFTFEEGAHLFYQVILSKK